MGLFDGLGSAASAGASLGSAFGPVGSAIGGLGGAVVSGVGSLLGTSQQNQANYQSQLDQYYYNAGLAQISNTMNTQNATTAFNRSQQQLSETEQYNSQMANTAFQRQVADLKAAGLNPILGMGTSGAPSPTASAAPPASPTVGSGGVGMPSYQSALGNAVSSAAQGAKLSNELRLGSATADQAEALVPGAEQDAIKKYWDAHSSQVSAKNAQRVVDASVSEINNRAAASSASAVNSLAQAAAAGGTVSGEFGGGIPGVANGKASVSGVPLKNISPSQPLFPGLPKIITGNPTGGASLY